jgi:hypothetical protein
LHYALLDSGERICHRKSMADPDPANQGKEKASNLDIENATACLLHFNKLRCSEPERKLLRVPNTTRKTEAC